jgi:hypothetical protein
MQYISHYLPMVLTSIRFLHRPSHSHNTEQRRSVVMALISQLALLDGHASKGAPLVPRTQRRHPRRCLSYSGGWIRLCLRRQGPVLIVARAGDCQGTIDRQVMSSNPNLIPTDSRAAHLSEPSVLRFPRAQRTPLCTLATAQRVPDSCLRTSARDTAHHSAALR